MTKKDILELTRRFKKNECTFTKLRGCYVDSKKNIILDINETFLNLVDEEFFKYLEIAKKTLSGTVNNNLLELEFDLDESNQSQKQSFLLGLRDSKLKNDGLLERLYELIIDNYDYEGQYLILAYHDAYDVVTKTTDNSKIDESEEVYEYILCAICPLELTKAGLGYKEDEHRIGARIRDWIVQPPVNGFVFPAFSDRSSDINSLIYYTKDTKDTHPELMCDALGCAIKRTATEEKKIFHNILKSAIADGESDNLDLFLEIQENLSYAVEEHNNIYEKEPFVLNTTVLKEVMETSQVPEEIAEKIEQICNEEFGDIPPIAQNLIDTKAVDENKEKKRTQQLQKEVIDLKQKLEVKPVPSSEETENETENESAPQGKNNIVLSLNPETAGEIKTQVIDGQKYILIPFDETQNTIINGINVSL